MIVSYLGFSVNIGRFGRARDFVQPVNNGFKVFVSDTVHFVSFVNILKRGLHHVEVSKERAKHHANKNDGVNYVCNKAFHVQFPNRCASVAGLKSPESDPE